MELAFELLSAVIVGCRQKKDKPPKIAMGFAVNLLNFGTSASHQTGREKPIITHREATSHCALPHPGSSTKSEANVKILVYGIEASNIVPT